MKIHEILGETTSAGGIASVTYPLGGGDSRASIYASKKSKKTDEMFSTRSLGLKGASKRSRDKARDKDKDKDKDREQTKTKTTMIRR